MSVDKQRLRATAVQVRAGIGDGPGDGWWFLLVRGLLAVGLGIAALFWPQATLNLLIRLIAVYALVDGVLGLLAALRAREFAAGFAPGLISILVAAVLLFWPDLTGRLLLTLLGIWALLQGVLIFRAGRQADTGDPDRGPTMVIGAGAGIVGLILAIWPGTGVVTISWAIGIAALLIGALLVFLALRLRRIDRRVQNLRRG